MGIIKIGLYLLSCLQKTIGFSEQVVANLRERYISECRARKGAAFLILNKLIAVKIFNVFTAFHIGVKIYEFMVGDKVVK